MIYKKNSQADSWQLTTMKYYSGLNNLSREKSREPRAMKAANRLGTCLQNSTRCYSLYALKAGTHYNHVYVHAFTARVHG